MLVLSRKVGERILIGDQIAVTIVRINGHAVRVGIEAPPEYAVVRQELADKMNEAKDAQAAVSDAAQDNSPNNLPR
jgi:carbon storage regulator